MSISCLEHKLVMVVMELEVLEALEAAVAVVD
jgi:hypothetical protein